MYLSKLILLFQMADEEQRIMKFRSDFEQ